jgi:cephalosporin hydroxylase
MMTYPRTHNLFSATFCGVEMRQYWADLPLWELFLNEHSVSAVVELGTFHGGMTLFLKTQALVRSQRFYTFDKDFPVVLTTGFARATGLESNFFQGDFWTTTNKALLDILHDQSVKPLMLFVDGGCKREEFKAFVPELSPGDYVAVHDYGTEFRSEDEEPVAHLLERVFWDECLAPPQPCLTRFWRRA